MTVNITTRHIELTPQLRSYAYKRLGKVKKYFNHSVGAQLILNAEKYRHVAEVFVQASGSNIRAKEQAGDIYSAIDKVMDKVEKQLKKYKERLKEHRKDKVYFEENLVKSSGKAGRRFTVTLTKKNVEVKSMSVKEALSSIESVGGAFCIFVNSDTKKINILHRKREKNYEIIEPQV